MNKAKPSDAKDEVFLAIHEILQPEQPIAERQQMRSLFT
jgi:hypothetical protein